MSASCEQKCINSQAPRKQRFPIQPCRQCVQSDCPGMKVEGHLQLAMQALTAMAPARVKVLAVDTSCQVPMQTVKCSTSKAYIFRSATEKPRKERMEGMPYSDAGQIKHIAPYAPQGEGAAAGAEDHPDAEGVSLPLPSPIPIPFPFPFLLLPCLAVTITAAATQTLHLHIQMFMH